LKREIKALKRKKEERKEEKKRLKLK